MERNSKKSTRCVWTTLVTTVFSLCVLFVFIILNSGTNHSLKSQGSPDHIPHSEKLTEEECIPVCGSEGCILQSKALLDYVQPASNPCDDFNQFACGGWTGKFPDGINPPIIRLHKQMRIKIKNVLESLKPSPNSASDKLKIVYDSCIKPDSETGAVPTLLHFLQKFGIKDWPHLTSNIEHIPLAKIIANLLLHDESNILTLSREDSSLLFGEQLEHPYALKVESEKGLLGGGIGLLGASIEAKKLQIGRILKYFKFDSEAVAKIQEEREAMNREIDYLRLESQNVSSVSELASLFVNCSGETENEWMDLCEVINLFLDVAKVNEEVSNQYVYIKSNEIHYMRNIFRLLRNYQYRVVANYLAIDVFFNHLRDLNLYFRLTNHNGADEIQKMIDEFIPIDRWLSCVDWITNEMQYALLYEYGKKEFTVDMFNEVKNLTDELLQETAEYYSRQEWVPESTRREKTEEIRNYILDTPSIKHFPKVTAVDEFYEEFKPENGNFLSNVMEFRRFKTVEKMRGNVDYKTHEVKVFEMIARGAGGYVELSVPFVQPPLFSTKTQRIFNLVSLGFVIEHEIGHSLLFDRRDYLLDHVQRSVQCMTDQISQYQLKFSGKNIDGKANVGEDMPDNIALSIIDKIIQRYVSEGVESLPGLPYPTEQLLYISNGFFFCSASSEKFDEIISKATHSPDDVRLYQRGRNSRLFSEVFDCPVGSYMNPADKCLFLTDDRSE